MPVPLLSTAHRPSLFLPPTILSTPPSPSRLVRSKQKIKKNKKKRILGEDHHRPRHLREASGPPSPPASPPCSPSPTRLPPKILCSIAPSLPIVSAFPSILLSSLLIVADLPSGRFSLAAAGGNLFAGAASFDDDPPLLEQLGINTCQIWHTIASILNPFRVNPNIHEDADLSGPFLFLVAFGLFLLLAGKFHFGIILS